MIISIGSEFMKGDIIREDIIRTKMAEIEESINLVEEYLPEDVEGFLALVLVKDGIYKRIEFAVESVIDICAIINTDLGLGIPTTEEDIVENLVKNKILSREMGSMVKGMKGFRNFLVHRYGKVDDSVAFESIKSGIGDFSRFIEKVKIFLYRHRSEKTV